MPIGFSISPRPSAIDPALLAAFAGIPTPIASDNMSRMFAGGAGLRPYHKGDAMLGVALTVRTRPGDNLMVHKAIDLALPGEVIVVDAGGDLTNAIIGEIMTSLAAKKGVAGFVIDGSVRDSDYLATSSLPVYARGVSHRGPYKDGPGEVNVVACIGGSPVYPGDIIIGDTDGVLAIPRAAAADIAKLCHAQIAREKAILASIADGTVDRRWVDEMLKAKGLAL
jgi:regulator of RNase E activity RraA